MLVLGLLGPIGSGKGAASSYLAKRYGFYHIVMGDLVRAEARRRKVIPTRERLRKLQHELRKKYGTDYLINLAVEKMIKSKKKRAIIDGIRLPIDAAVAKKRLNAKLILVDAKPVVRFERLRKRRRRGFPTTLTQFKKQEQREWKLFDFKKTLRYVDYKVENNASKEQLYAQLDRLMKRIK